MTTALSLHHVGEPLLAALLGKLARWHRLDAISCKLHTSANCTLASILVAAGVPPPYSFAVNVALAPIPYLGTTLGFDGGHGVDVLCHGGGLALPIEAKLGLEGVAPTAFARRFLQALTISDHPTPRCNGGMTAILNHRRIGNELLDIRTGSPAATLAPAWLLVLRAQTWAKWRSPPELHNAHVVVFEDLARSFGDGAAFDELVLDVVGRGFHAAWEVYS